MTHRAYLFEARIIPSWLKDLGRLRDSASSGPPSRGLATHPLA